MVFVYPFAQSDVILSLIHISMCIRDRLGILTLGLIQNSLNMLGVSSYLKMVFQGLIILVAVFMDLQTRKLEASSK